MLPPAEQSLVDRDPDLPGLRLLLDSERLTHWLTSLLGRPVTARRRHLRYKPGKSCVLHVDASGQALLVAATAPSEAAKHAKTLERSAGSIIGTAPDLQILVGTPAADRDLPGVALLTDADRRPLLLHRLLRTGAQVDPDAEPTLLRYKPHRRWVGLLPTYSGDHIVLRVQRPAASRAAAAALAALVAGEPRTPRLIGFYERRGVLAAEYLRGNSAQSAPAEVLEPVGRALAALHRRSCPALLEQPLSAEARKVRAAAGQLGALLPELADRAADLAGLITARLTTLPEVRVPVHGDFSADQAVIGPDGRPGLIDLDSAGLGDPAADLGCAQATMIQDVVLGRLTDTEQQHRLAMLHAGYVAGGGPADADRVPVHRAAHLLRLTAEPFRLGQTADWAGAADALLTEAETAVADLAGVRA
ncbi:phosphotransferase family protein [Ruania zhangjianzhongii]|uniref:phosphotransferase family protein n=1 Tax=Ruania zhangjianzhongii TaxID=2603206 RepID=UPI00143D2149|nr:phosphotransferase [Ruania zhangjianzhongii]